jgi:hypothetical protein
MGGLIKEIKFGVMGKTLNVVEKTTRDTSKNVTKTVLNNIDIHLRNTEGCRLGTVSSIIMTTGEFKPVNGAPFLVDLVYHINVFNTLGRSKSSI